MRPGATARNSAAPIPRPTKSAMSCVTRMRNSGPPPSGYATLAIEAGEDTAVVSRALGHASVAITADVYMHVTPAMRDGLAARMEAVLGA